MLETFIIYEINIMFLKTITLAVETSDHTLYIYMHMLFQSEMTVN